MTQRRAPSAPMPMKPQAATPSPSLWRTPATTAQLDAYSANTASAHMGIEYLELGPDSVSARMPVDARTRQPFGLLHGGASVLLAETLGSVAAHLAAAPGSTCVGLEVNANHLRAVRTGWVIGTARPLHVGRRTQVWQIDIRDEAEHLCCTARLTVAVDPPRHPQAPATPPAPAHPAA